MRIFIKALAGGLLLSLISFLGATPGDYYQRTLVFAADHNYPPYEFADKDGQPTGLNVEILQAAARYTGLDIEIKTLPWNTCITELIEGKVDGTVGMYFSIDRSKSFHFSRGYCNVMASFITNKASTEIKKIDDLKGKEIIVQDSNVMNNYILRENITDKLVVVPDVSEIITLLSTGEHDAALVPKCQAMYYILEKGVTNLKFIPGCDLPLEFCFAVLPENRDLNIILNEGLMAIKDNGTHAALEDKWLSEYQEKHISKELLFKYIVVSLTVVLIVAIIVILIVLSLKSKLKSKTQDLEKELEAHRTTHTELKENFDKFQYLVNNIYETVFEADSEGNILFISNNIEKMVGLKPSEIYHRFNIFDIPTPEGRERLRNYFATLSTEISPFIKLKTHSLQGKTVDILFNASLTTREKTGAHIIGTIVDHTEIRKQEAVREVLLEVSESTHTTEDMDTLFKKIHQSVGKLMPVQNFYIATYDEDTNIISFPYFITEKEGCPGPRSFGKGITEYMIHQRTSVLFDKESLYALYEKGEIELIGTPSEIWLGAPLIIKEKIIGAIVVQDYHNKDTYGEDDRRLLTYVSEQIASAIYRKITEEISNRRKAYYRELFNNTPAGIALVNNQDTIQDVNQTFLDMFEYSYDEVINKKINSLIVPQELSQEAELYSISTQQGNLIQTETVRKTKSNKLLYVKLFGTPIIVNKKQEAIFGIYIDITDLHHLQQSLMDEKNRLHTMLSSIGDGVIATDKEGNIVLMNRTASKLTGFEEGEALGKPMKQIFKVKYESGEECIQDIVARVCSTRQVIELSNSNSLKSKDGTEHIIEKCAAPIQDNRGNLIGVIVVFRDTTEKKKFETELQKSAKLESLGILAGGIAHDFNNILTALLGNLTLARLKCEEENEIEISKKILEAEKAVLRAKNLTSQLLTYSKGGDPIKTTASISEIIEDVVSFSTVGSIITHKILLPEDLWNIEVDAGQIGQVIHNLTINAVQAMPDGGSLTIEAQNVTLDKLKYEFLKPGNYVAVTVKDTGIGIEKSVLDNIFDPFFTTKQEGTGLGLSTSISIIKKHGGYITVNSIVNEGTTFTIYLPATDKKKRDTTFGEIRGKGSGHILVMDDDADLLPVIQEMLESLGYTVTAVVTGEEAIEVYKEYFKTDKHFVAVILDLTIKGGMGGKQAAQEILSIDPEAFCIVSSGYSSDPIMADYSKYGFKGVLRKPYPVNELASLLASLVPKEG